MNNQVAPLRVDGEEATLAWLRQRFGAAPTGQVWAGDDAAVLGAIRRPLFATDIVVEGVHVDRRWCSAADIGWKALSVNVSDIAAMAGIPVAAVVAIAGGDETMIEGLAEGIAAAAAYYDCAVVGGDLSDAATLAISVAIIGEAIGDPVLRSGARPGDVLYVTGPLGAAAAGLERLVANPASDGPLEQRHRRPIARVEHGRVFGGLGVHAMIDCSDGLGLDVDRLARASGVGVVVEEIPCAPGASVEHAMSGGEDYELLVAAPADLDLTAACRAAGLEAPLRIGRCSDVAGERVLNGEPFVPRGYLHRLGGGICTGG